MTTVVAPCPGRLLPLAQVPDPVFAAEMVGPGVGLDPDPGEVAVVSPIAGTAVKVHPHAFVVQGADGLGVLVHLGINTVRLEGRGFEVLAQEGAALEAGTPVVRWDPSTISGPDLSPVVLVVALDQPAGSVPAPVEGTAVVAGDPLFDVG
ncbi:PTS glucose transporter subunit IIA [Angustibacter peucedani]